MSRMVGVAACVLGLCCVALGPVRAHDAPPPLDGRLLLLDRGLGLGEGRHGLSVTQEPGTRVIAEVMAPRGSTPGAAALFEVVASDRASLRRLPAMGREDAAEPLCRVMAAPGGSGGEVGEGRRDEVAGAWRVVSRGADGSVHRLGWEWWSDGRDLAGRFDPSSDFRFARILRGTNGGGRVAFTVEYIQDHYDVRGRATATGWSGTWTKRGEADTGTWTAARPDEGRDIGGLLEPRVAEPLRAWRRAGDGASWVGLGKDRPTGEGWVAVTVLGAAWRHRGAMGGSVRGATCRADRWDYAVGVGSSRLADAGERMDAARAREPRLPTFP